MRGRTVLAIISAFFLVCWVTTHFFIAQYWINFREWRAELAVGNGEVYFGWYPVPETWFDIWGGVFTYDDSPPPIRETLFGKLPYPTFGLEPSHGPSMGWFPTSGGVGVPFWNLALIGGVAWFVCKMRRGWARFRPGANGVVESTGEVRRAERD